MEYKDEDKSIYVGVRLTETENQRLNDAWKSAKNIMNRSQFIRAALNHYVGYEMCATNQ